MRIFAASSQHEIGTSSRTTCTEGGDGVRVFENFWSSSTVCLDVSREQTKHPYVAVLTWLRLRGTSSSILFRCGCGDLE